MVVLSDSDYRGLMEAGRLKIDPEPEDHDLQPASIEIRMGRETWITNFKLPTFDIGLLQRFGKRYFIKDGEDLTLYPGLVYYVKSLADFVIPVPAKTEGRSSLGRLGVSVKAVNLSPKYTVISRKKRMLRRRMKSIHQSHDYNLFDIIRAEIRNELVHEHSPISSSRLAKKSTEIKNELKNELVDKQILYDLYEALSPTLAPQSHKYIGATHSGPLWFVIEANAFPVKIYPGTAICHLVMREPTNMDIMSSGEVAKAYGKAFALHSAGSKELLEFGAVSRGNALQLTLAETELKRGVDRGRPFDIRDGADEGDYFESVDIGEKGVVMEAGRFYLAHAREQVMVNNEVIGFLQQLDPESGILAQWEAGLFDPGFVGQPVLEMMQFGRTNLLLFPGQEIGKLVFERLSRPSARGYGDFKGKAGKGKYYDQSGTVTSRIYME